jgi:hypothetical protein
MLSVAYKACLHDKWSTACIVTRRACLRVCALALAAQAGLVAVTSRASHMIHGASYREPWGVLP